MPHNGLAALLILAEQQSDNDDGWLTIWQLIHRASNPIHQYRVTAIERLPTALKIMRKHASLTLKTLTW